MVDTLKLMLLTDDPVVARVAQDAGVQRIFYDLEYINKRERQHGRNTVISNYDIEGIPAVRSVLTSSELLVRVNPIYFHTKAEVDQAIAYGADVIMLPMTLDPSDAQRIVSAVDKRARVCIMIETAPALARLPDILEVPGIDEVFVGLNDLHIALGLSFMFEILSGGLMDYIAGQCKKKGIPFGFGGIAKIGEGDLPAEYVIGEHKRLGSSSVILSRVFKNCFTPDGGANLNFDFAAEVEKIRERERACDSWKEYERSENIAAVKRCVQSIVEKKRNAE